MKPQPIRLKELRNEKNLKQEELAELLGIVLRQYQRYERGEQEPSLAKWLFLADFYNVSLDYLVGRSADRTFHP
ncbi:MAG: helix-turn-helix transcriptional regulator [Oscillospiraceae bacterium]|nr:helix-turn-helix transcriptional regulator [Oscillospiraceae bacterium]